MPEISVIMPLYNHEKYVSDAVNSVLKQTYRDFELLVIDDGSDDNSSEIVKSFTDSRIRLFSFEKNQGVSVAMNKGIAEAEGRYIAILDSDDLYLPTKLERQIDYLEKHNNIGAVFTGVRLIDENGNDFKDKGHPYFNVFKQRNRSRFEWLNYFFYNGNCLAHPGVLIRRECYDEVGNYDQRLFQIPDFDLWIRLCMEYDIHIIDEKLFKYRIRDNDKNNSGQNPQAQTRLEYEFSKVLTNFNKLDKKSFAEVFPDEETAEEDFIPYLIARKALNIERVSYKLFAINTLFQLLNCKEMTNIIKDEFGFNYSDLIKITGENKLFAIPSILKTRIYIDEGSGYNEEKSISQLMFSNFNDLPLEFDLSNFSSIKKIRWDPVDNKVCNVRLNSLSCEKESGEEEFIELDSLKTNGRINNEGLIRFNIFDPRISFPVKGKVKKLKIRGEIITAEDLLERERERNEKLREELNDFYNSNSWRVTAPLREIRYFFKRIKRRFRNYKKYVIPHNYIKLISYYRKYGLKNTLYKIKSKQNDKSRVGPEDIYQKWIENNENYRRTDVMKNILSFSYKPKISIIMPVYNVEEKWLRKCIDSVKDQYYDNWELCIADDNSTEKHIKSVLEEYMDRDNRIKAVFREENGHISKASNSALELATGEFIALLDNDDELPPFALYEVVKLLNEHPEADLIYSDEDKIDERGKRKDPHFKPGWSPDTLLSCNYITHLGVYRKELVDDIGGFRAGYEGSQDYDLVLRFTEKTDEIYHIPEVLYHWRMIKGSTSIDISGKNYAYKAGMKALKDTVKRRNYNAEVYYTEGLPLYNIRFNCNEDNNLVSIIIPTKDKADILAKCINSIYEKTNYNNFEIIVIDNGSIERETFNLFNILKKEYANLKILKLDIPFNFSKLNNEAVRIAKGNLLLFLNNDIEVINGDWLKIMAGQAQRESIGAVGAKLLYPDGKIQHAGVILGLGGVAAHAYRMGSKNDIGYTGRLRINYNYSAVTAACMMVKKSIFNEVNGFEEELAVAFNDVDFCLKIMRKGYYNIFLPDVELYHHESISRGKDDNTLKLKRFNNEVKYMREKWDYLLDNDPFYNPNLSLNNPYFQIAPDPEL